MKVPTRPRRYGLQFNVTALIDIVFLLIIFFLAANHLVSRETQKEVELPRVEHQPDEAAAGSRIVVTIDQEQRLFVGGEEIDMENLAGRIAAGGAAHPDTFAVYIRAHRRTPFRVIRGIVTACAKAGVTRVYYAYTARTGE